MDIHSGLITVIMGLSGSGKPTLIRHLNRLIEPTAGDILLDGQNILTCNQTELRALRQTKMSMVFQKFALMPHRTVVENSMLAPLTRGEKNRKPPAKMPINGWAVSGLKALRNITRTSFLAGCSNGLD